jgi:hypothetical protein
VPASRANHALLTINGQFYGLYITSDRQKKMIAVADNSGSLFEATDVDFADAYRRLRARSGADDRTRSRPGGGACRRPTPP